jgi:hypothetical protein
MYICMYVPIIYLFICLLFIYSFQCLFFIYLFVYLFIYLVVYLFVIYYLRIIRFLVIYLFIVLELFAGQAQLLQVFEAFTVFEDELTKILRSVFKENPGSLNVEETSRWQLPSDHRVSRDTYLIAEFVRQKMITDLVPHFQMEQSNPVVTTLLETFRRVGIFRHWFSHYKGELPSRVECAQRLREICKLLSSGPFMQRTFPKAHLEALSTGQLQDISKCTAIKYLLRQLLYLAQRAGNEYISAIDAQGMQ